MVPPFIGKIGNVVKGVALFVVKSTVGYMPMMLLRLISRKINEQSTVKSAQQQREYAQALANRMRAAPGGGRPQQVGTHYQPPYYYHEVAYGKEISPELDITYE